MRQFFSIYLLLLVACAPNAKVSGVQPAPLHIVRSNCIHVEVPGGPRYPRLHHVNSDFLVELEAVQTDTREQIGCGEATTEVTGTVVVIVWPGQPDYDLSVALRAGCKKSFDIRIVTENGVYVGELHVIRKHPLSCKPQSETNAET